jgi:hypothetical protein
MCLLIPFGTGRLIVVRSRYWLNKFVKREKIGHGIEIVKNLDFFLQDKNSFERTEKLCFKSYYCSIGLVHF